MLEFTAQFDRVAIFVTSPMGVLVICACIVGWAIIAYLTFRVRINPVIRELRKVSGNLPSKFVEEFEQYDESVRHSPVLEHIWHEFDETLIKLPDSEPPAIKNTCGAGEYFTQAAVVGNRLNLRFYNALPNLLTGTGILGTFIGLVAGIWLASKGLASSDAETVKQSLQALLHGASLAFLTSIAGLITSILFSWREKHWIHKLESLRGRWISMLDSSLDRVNNELLSHEILAESRDQTVVLKSFTQDLAFQIADAFQEKMSTSLTPLMDRLVDAVESLRTEQQQSNDSALQMMVEKFSDQLTGSAGQELTKLGDTLNDLNDKLGSQIEAMSERHREIEDASRQTVDQLGSAFNSGIEQFRTEVSASIKEITTGLGGVVTEMSEQIRNATKEATDRFSQITKEFDSAIGNVRESLGGAAELAERYHEIISKTEAAMASVNEANAALAGVVEPISDAAIKFGQTSTEMQGVSQKISETSSEISRAVDNIGGLQEDIKAVWQNYQTRFESVDNGLARVFEELDSGLGRYTQTVKGFIEGLDQHTSSIVSDLAGASSELNSAIEELSDTLSKR